MALRVSSHPGDDPDSKAFPSPAGAGSGPAPSQEVTETVPGLALTQPPQHARCIQAWGRALDPWQEEPPQHHSLPDPEGDPGSCSEPRSPQACLPPVGYPAWGSWQHPSASVTLGMGATPSLPAVATVCVPCIFHGRQLKAIPMKLEWRKEAVHREDKPPWLHRPWGRGEVAAVSAPPAAPAHLTPVLKCPWTAFRRRS